MSTQGDIDIRETAEWIEALEGVVANEGPARAHYLIETLIATARQEGVNIPYSATTEYINTIPAEQQPPYPGDPDMEIKLHSYIRWNAMAMVVRANKDTTSVATSPPSLRQPPCTTSVSRTSGTRLPMPTTAT